ncbi:MAG: DUF4105 domain-containing protein [Salibacteraceae bacterium]
MRVFLNIFFLLGFFFSLNSSIAQQKLDSASSISLVTCGNGYDLYSIFGHTAIRVKDTVNNMDIVFNYGTFHFSDDFLVLFAMGKLNYTLSVQNYEGFERSYRLENRWVEEQVLNLNFNERQSVFDYLQTNYLPENREYLYDFFYDNCCTRSRDVFEATLGNRLQFNFTEQQTDSTFKDLLDVYLGNMPWVDIGMDLGLGIPADKVLTEREKMYIPDYVYRAFDSATIQRNNKTEPFVLKTTRIVDSIDIKPSFNWFQPNVIFIGTLILWLLIAFIPIIKKSIYAWDALLFSITGLAGWLIVFLWFITDHTTTQINFDILWANPFLFPIGLLALKRKKPLWLSYFFTATTSLSALVLVTWPFLPSDLNESFIPIILLLIWRSFVHSKIEKE